MKFTIFRSGLYQGKRLPCQVAKTLPCRTVRRTFLCYLIFSIQSTDIQGRSQNLRHFYPNMGLKLGVFRVFPVIKITIVHQVRMSPASTIYCGLSMKTNRCKTLHGTQRSWTHLFCFCFCTCWDGCVHACIHLHQMGLGLCVNIHTAQSRIRVNITANWRVYRQNVQSQGNVYCYFNNILLIL